MKHVFSERARRFHQRSNMLIRQQNRESRLLPTSRIHPWFGAICVAVCVSCSYFCALYGCCVYGFRHIYVYVLVAPNQSSCDGESGRCTPRTAIDCINCFSANYHDAVWHICGCWHRKTTPQERLRKFSMVGKCLYLLYYE